jgi:hypothetical protein
MAYWYSITPAGALTARMRPPTLKQLQMAVGGYIEPVPMVNLPLALNLLCNEQPVDDSQVNFIAQFITSIPVRGTIVVVGPASDEEDVDWEPVPARYDAFLRGFADVVAELRELHNARLSTYTGRATR